MIAIKDRNPVIIIPAYCPDQRLITLIGQIRNKSNYPIIVIDDGSGSRYTELFLETKKISNCLLYHNNINKGKGATLKNGVTYAIDKFPNNCGYITCDADGQHSVEDILNIANILMENSSSLILGVRDLSLNTIPSKSKIGNTISSILFNFITGIKCNDTQTGLRGISREHEILFLSEKGDRYEFEMNFLTAIAKRNINIKEVPIKTIYINNNETSHFRAVTDSIRIFNSLLKYSASSLLSAAIDIGLFIFFTTSIFKYYSSNILFSTILARIMSGTLNFSLNQNWVFNTKASYAAGVKYLILFITQMLCSGLLVWLLHKVISNAIICKLLIDTLLFFTSYFIQKNIVFTDKKSPLLRKKVS